MTTEIPNSSASSQSPSPEGLIPVVRTRISDEELRQRFDAEVEKLVKIPSARVTSNVPGIVYNHELKITKILREAGVILTLDPNGNVVDNQPGVTLVPVDIAKTIVSKFKLKDRARNHQDVEKFVTAVRLLIDTPEAMKSYDHAVEEMRRVSQLSKKSRTQACLSTLVRKHEKELCAALEVAEVRLIVDKDGTPLEKTQPGHELPPSEIAKSIADLYIEEGKSRSSKDIVA